MLAPDACTQRTGGQRAKLVQGFTLGLGTACRQVCMFWMLLAMRQAGVGRGAGLGQASMAGKVYALGAAGSECRAPPRHPEGECWAGVHCGIPGDAMPWAGRLRRRRGGRAARSVVPLKRLSGCGMAMLVMWPVRGRVPLRRYPRPLRAWAGRSEGLSGLRGSQRVQRHANNHQACSPRNPLSTPPLHRIAHRLLLAPVHAA